MRELFAALLRPFGFLIRPDKPTAALRAAQMRGLTHQIPLLYVLLTVNTDLLGVAFIGRAPLWLSIGGPAAFTLCFIWRAWIWWRLRHPYEIPLETARRMIDTIPRSCLVLGLLCSAWALTLSGFGGEAAKLHVAFYMAVTVIGCLFCLTHVPKAALMLTASVMIPFFGVFAWQGGRDIPLVAINAALVFWGFLLVLSDQYRGFTALVTSRERLLAAQAESQTLYVENVRLANLDQLTGLPNRRIFFEMLAERLAQGERVALAVIDLDGFKPINDVYGHGAGDDVLAETAARLRRLADDRSVARLGGDEFAVIVSGCSTRAELLSWGAQACQALREPYRLDGATVRLSGSVGLSPFARKRDDGRRLLEKADYALYSAKAHRRGEAAMFTPAHGRELRRTAMVGQALRAETLSEELSLAFQPVIDSHSGAVLGFEALARWRSPTLGQVPPQEFIGVAERMGLVSGLTVILLRKALAAAAAWPDHLRLSFNLSASDLMNADAMAAVRDLVRTGPFAAARIDFEVTETALMSDFDRAAEALASLRALGCGLSLDDFGTGRSSLSYVHRLPLDKIKIDRSFVANLDDGGSAAGVVGAIVSMCRSLRLDCVVEGVETPEQLVRLRQLGCRMVQGYVFSRPLAASAVRDYLASRAAAGVEEAGVEEAGVEEAVRAA